MTEHDFTQIRYWFDLAIKAIIGVVVSLVGLDYREIKTTLRELEQKKYELVAQAEVTHFAISDVKARLERIDQKIDQALKK
jgi:hypothetical protein